MGTFVYAATSTPESFGRREKKREEAVSCLVFFPIMVGRVTRRSATNGVGGGVDPTTTEEDFNMDYEKERELRKARNLARMLELKLPEASFVVKEEKAKPAVARKASQRGVKRQKREPVVARRSLRVRGMKPNGEMAQGIKSETNAGVTLNAGGSLSFYASEPKKPSRKAGPVPFESIYEDDEEEQKVLDVLRDSRSVRSKAKTSTSNLSDVTLREENVMKVTKSGTVHLDIMPRTDRLVVAAGDKEGHVGVWSLSSDFADQHNVLVKPHTQYISGLKWSPSTGRDLYTCSYDGFCRKLDVSKGAASFLELTNSEIHEFSAFDVDSQGNNMFLCTNDGDFLVIDTRSNNKDGSSAAIGPIELHNRKINTVHVEPSEGNLFVTSSTDKSVTVWDIRLMGNRGMKTSKKAVVSYYHGKSCQGAYFAPDGSHRVLTTCYDNHLNIFDVKRSKGFDVSSFSNWTPDKEKPVVRMSHNTQTGRWVLPFRAVWLPGSDGVVCGTMKRGVQMYSSASGKRMAHYDSDFMTAIPSRCCVHPTLPILGAATSSGRIHLFSS